MNGQVLVFDNLSGISAEMSDCLCRLSTGGGFATRALYSDDEEVIFEGQRPIALTSINDVASRSDLADRAMVVNLETISEENRRPQKKVYGDFDAARPAILGALLDVVAHGLMQLPYTHMNRLPRMADFALWVRACEDAIWSAGSFMAAYETNLEEAADVVLDSDPVGLALRNYLKVHGTFTGTASQLFDALTPDGNDGTGRNKFWPANAKSLSGRLKRLTPALLKVGIEIQRRKGTDKKSNRLIDLSQRHKPGDSG